MISPFPFALAALAVIIIRHAWVQYSTEAYALQRLHYLTMNRLNTEVAVDMDKLWPRRWMYWDLINWDFRRYVVDHESYDRMMAYMGTQLARTDLDYATFRSELDAVESADAAAIKALALPTDAQIDAHLS